LSTWLFLLVCFQPSLPNQDVIERAALDLSLIDDVPRFFAEHNRRIEVQIDRLLDGEKLEDVSLDGRQVTIAGRLRPDLFKMEAAIRVVSVAYGGMNSSVARELMARGFPERELPAFERSVTGDNANAAFVNRVRHEDAELKRFFEKTRVRYKDIRAYLERSEALFEEANRQWATEVLDVLSLRARRVLVSYAYEVWVASSTVYYREGPIARAEIHRFREGLDKQVIEDERGREND